MSSELENINIEKNKELFEYEMTEVILKLKGEFAAFSGKDTKFAEKSVPDEKLSIKEGLKPVKNVDCQSITVEYKNTPSSNEFEINPPTVKRKDCTVEVPNTVINRNMRVNTVSQNFKADSENNSEPDTVSASLSAGVPETVIVKTAEISNVEIEKYTVNVPGMPSVSVRPLEKAKSSDSQISLSLPEAGRIKSAKIAEVKQPDHLLKADSGAALTAADRNTKIRAARVREKKAEVSVPDTKIRKKAEIAVFDADITGAAGNSAAEQTEWKLNGELPEVPSISIQPLKAAERNNSQIRLLVPEPGNIRSAEIPEVSRPDHPMAGETGSALTAANLHTKIRAAKVREKRAAVSVPDTRIRKAVEISLPDTEITEPSADSAAEQTKCKMSRELPTVPAVSIQPLKAAERSNGQIRLIVPETGNIRSAEIPEVSRPDHLISAESSSALTAADRNTKIRAVRVRKEETAVLVPDTEIRKTSDITTPDAEITKAAGNSDTEQTEWTMNSRELPEVPAISIQPIKTVKSSGKPVSVLVPETGSAGLVETAKVYKSNYTLKAESSAVLSAADLSMKKRAASVKQDKIAVLVPDTAVEGKFNVNTQSWTGYPDPYELIDVPEKPDVTEEVKNIIALALARK